MLLLRGNGSGSTGQDGWSAQAQMRADADEVLDALTDPAAIAAWAPVRFEVDGLAGGRLRPGGRERVTGSLAGIRTTFDVEVYRADAAGLELVARGPVVLRVAWRFRDLDEGVLVDASVRIDREGGLTAQLLRAALATLLNAGALASALRRLELSFAGARENELVAA